MKEMNVTNVWPLIILAAGAVVLLIVISIKRNHPATNTLTALILTAAVGSFLFFPPEAAAPGALFHIDAFGGFVMALILMAGLTVTILSYSYLEKHEINREEYYVMILLGTTGAAALAVANHLISFFLALELLSVSLYVMIGYLKVGERSVEAAVKYLILAGVSSAFLLMGMAAVYFKAGALDFNGLALQLAKVGFADPLVLTGLGLMIIGVGFKMAVVPFHLWTPDVYEGAPAPTTAFIASISKGGIVALWLRLFTELNGYASPELLTVFIVIAVLSMLLGNLLALLQKNVKRILAYSSIAHLGYILVAFIAGGGAGSEAVLFYLMAYFITILAAFAIVSLLSTSERDAFRLEDYRGLYWRKPALAAAFTAILLSLAGIPLTVGFIGKYYILLAGVVSEYVGLAVALVAGSVIGLFYYLRIVVEMLKKPETSTSTFPGVAFSFSGGFVVAVLVALLVWFGIFPAGVAELIGRLAIGG